MPLKYIATIAKSKINLKFSLIRELTKPFCSVEKDVIAIEIRTIDDVTENQAKP